MPRQNRVTPWGEIVAVPERGALMGNRGCLHDAGGRLMERRWGRKAWVTCLLEFGGRKRTVMAPGQYTELFFLDEATALAAGHRPCNACRRDRLKAFVDHWLRANGDQISSTAPRLPDIDEVLHAERVHGDGHKRTYVDHLGDLPAGVMVARVGVREALLLTDDAPLVWTPGGYESYRDRLPADTKVEVLTPPSVVRAIRAGYRPEGLPVASARGILFSRGLARRRDSGGDAGAETEASPGPRPSQEASGGGRERAGSAPGPRLYRLRRTPSGKELFTYFAAILEVTGMDRGAVFPLKKFLGNFSTHEQAGRIRRVNGGYQLTPQGRDYFMDRYSPGNRQHVSRQDVALMARKLREGGGESWIPVD